MPDEGMDEADLKNRMSRLLGSKQDYRRDNVCKNFPPFVVVRWQSRTGDEILCLRFQTSKGGLERILIYQVEQGANFKFSSVCDRHLDTDAQRPDQPFHSNLRKNRTFRLALRRSG